MQRLSFRTRLFAILTIFALAPAVLLTVILGVSVWRALPDLSASEAWERIAHTGQTAIESLRDAPLNDRQRAALALHETELEASVNQAKRLQFIVSRFAPVIFFAAFAALGVLWIAASRVAGHLSRQLSRPIDELVGWTAMIEKGDELPGATSRGAPEFETLRQRMRRMATELTTSRQRMRDAERSIAFRETARRVAHELKNPLTPIQFAVAQIKKDAPPSLSEPIRVLAEETARLDRMAKSFAQYGRLEEGPTSEIHLGELAASALGSAAPPGAQVALTIDQDTPPVHGRYDALHRAVVNVILNAVEACGERGAVAVRVQPTANGGAAIEVADTGPGIAPGLLQNVWEPYVTDKVGGTGLGLAIVRQTVQSHGGAVSVHSEPGKGTTFRIELPARTADHPHQSDHGS